MKMKKLAFLFGALVMGFMITSCGESVKDSMMKEIDALKVSAPTRIGDIIKENILGLDVNIVITKNID